VQPWCSATWGQEAAAIGFQHIHGGGPHTSAEVAEHPQLQSPVGHYFCCTYSIVKILVALCSSNALLRGAKKSAAIGFQHNHGGGPHTRAEMAEHPQLHSPVGHSFNCTYLIVAIFVALCSSGARLRGVKKPRPLGSSTTLGMVRTHVQRWPNTLSCNLPWAITLAARIQL